MEHLAHAIRNICSNLFLVATLCDLNMINRHKMEEETGLWRKLYERYIRNLYSLRNNIN